MKWERCNSGEILQGLPSLFTIAIFFNSHPCETGLGRTMWPRSAREVKGKAGCRAGRLGRQGRALPPPHYPQTPQVPPASGIRAQHQSGTGTCPDGSESDVPGSPGSGKDSSLGAQQGLQARVWADEILESGARQGLSEEAGTCPAQGQTLALDHALPNLRRHRPSRRLFSPLKRS